MKKAGFLILLIVVVLTYTAIRVSRDFARYQFSAMFG